MSDVQAHRLAEVFVEVADTLIDDFDLVEFLQMLTNRAAELVGARAVGLLLADVDGRLRFMAASSEEVRLLELFQLQAGEGPCLDAFRNGAPVRNADLGAAVDRWPLFAARASAKGFRSVHAMPLRLRRTVIGAMGVFGCETGNLDSKDAHTVQALADVATIALVQQRTIREAETLTEQLQSALNSRVVIEQAKGAVAEHHGLSIDEAFHTLRSFARAHQRRLGDVAQAVLASPEAMEKIRPPTA